MSESGDFGFPDDLAELPDGWEYQPLAELVDDKRGICYGIVQPGSHTTEGIPIVRVNNIKVGRIDSSDMLRVTEDIESKYVRSRLRGGEVLLTLVGSLGESAVVPPELAGWNVARAVGVIPVKQEIGPRWVELCLRSSRIQHFIRTRATTTVQATFNLRDVAKLPVPVPPKREREAIAAVLGSLDDRIELNRRMNETLEAITRALFQNWFVDFGPVNGKLDERLSTGMDDETLRLFPARFCESELGLIPQGWTVASFSNAFKIPLRNGLTRPKRVRGDGIRMVNMGELFANRRIGNIEMDRVPLKGEELERNLLEPGDLLFARQSLVLAGAGQCSIFVGAGEPITFESHLIRCRLDDQKSSPWFFFHYLLSPQGRARVASIVEQVAAAGIRGSDLAKMSVLMPPVDVQRAFGQVITPFENRIALNIAESRTLAALRDALLPKLLSGELRVPAAAKLVEANA